MAQLSDQYLTFDEACMALERLRGHDTLILGIERFVRVSNGLKPDIGAIADFSSLDPSEKLRSWQEAKAFMALFGRDADERFQFTLGKG